jgi:hypothetical protein
MKMPVFWDVASLSGRNWHNVSEVLAVSIIRAINNDGSKHL